VRRSAEPAAAEASIDLSTWLILAAVSVGTSIVSGVMGLAGGMLLLAVLLLYLDPIVAIPVHGVVQLVSNASRAWFQRRHVRWDAVWRFAWPLLPAGAAGLHLLRSVPPDAGRLVIGVFVLVATWAPGWLRFGARAEDPRRALAWGGGLVGFASTSVGATGPLLAPFILALGLGTQATVGTLAACQIFQHLSKLVLFGATGFDFGRFALPLVGLCAGSVAGSAIGAHLLDRVPEQMFRRVVRILLSALALELAFEGVVLLFGC
jgi:uncharacterized membrane protein YfcA